MTETAQYILIAVYPSVFFPDRKGAEDMARRAIGMPRIDNGEPTEVHHVWVEGDDYAGKVYATLKPRTGPNMLTLEYLKMRELEEEGYTVETVMDCSFRRLVGYV